MQHVCYRCIRNVSPWLSAIQMKLGQTRSISRNSAINQGLRKSNKVTERSARNPRRQLPRSQDDQYNANPDYQPTPSSPRQGIYRPDGTYDPYPGERSNQPLPYRTAPMTQTDRREERQRRVNRQLVARYEQKREELNSLRDYEHAGPASDDTNPVSRGRYTSIWEKKPRQTNHHRGPAIKQPDWKGLENPVSDHDFSMSVPLATAASTFVYGKRCVTAALKANRRKLYHLYYIRPETPSDNESDRIKDLAATRHVRCTPLSNPSFRQLLTASGLKALPTPVIDDGVALEVSPLPQPPITCLRSYSPTEATFDFTLDRQPREEEAINGKSTKGRYNDSHFRAPFLLWLHGVVDVQNVGSIYRTALYFGADGVILSPRETMRLSTAVPKSSVGAVEYVPSYKAPLDAATFMQRSQAHGWTFFAAVSPSIGNLGSTRSPLLLHEMGSSPATKGPCVLVLGNEDEGLPNQFVKQCDSSISIMGSLYAARTGLDSLNVGTAAALFCERFLVPPSNDLLLLQQRPEQPSTQDVVAGLDGMRYANSARNSVIRGTPALNQT